MTSGVVEKPTGDITNENVDDRSGSGIEPVGEKKTSSDGELEAHHIDIHEAEAKRILKKVDFRLVPVLSLLYLVAFIDRSNSEHCQLRELGA